MIEEDGGTLRAVAWDEVFPWTSICRSVRIAAGLRVLLISALGLVLTASGWALFGWMFSGQAEIAEQVGAGPGCPWTTAADLVPDSVGLPQRGLWPDLSGAGGLMARSTDPMLGTWEQLSRPFGRTFRLNLDSPEPAGAVPMACYLLCGLWALAIWAFAGGAVSRVAAVRLASGERIGWAEMLRFACGKWKAFFWAPLLPLLAVWVACVLIGLLGFLLRLNLGLLVAGIVWPLLLAAVALLVLLLVGVWFGWPLMFAAISTEGTDSFDALSRSYAYVFQRPLHYLCYAIMAAVVGTLGWIVVSNFASGVVLLTYWAAEWGSGQGHFVLTGSPIPRVEFLFAGGQPARGVGIAGAGLIRFWSDCAKLFAAGYLYSFFFTASTAIYLLLRRDVDDTDLDEVYLEDEGQEQDFALPPIETDAAGAPVAADEQDAPAEPEKPAESDSAEEEGGGEDQPGGA